MMKEWRIGYCASWKCDGSLVTPEQPFQNAYIEASTAEEAVHLLAEEFPGWKFKISEVEEHVSSDTV